MFPLNMWGKFMVPVACHAVSAVPLHSTPRWSRSARSRQRRAAKGRTGQGRAGTLGIQLLRIIVLGFDARQLAPRAGSINHC